MSYNSTTAWNPDTTIPVLIPLIISGQTKISNYCTNTQLLFETWLLFTVPVLLTTWLQFKSKLVFKPSVFNQIRINFISFNNRLEKGFFLINCKILRIICNLSQCEKLNKKCVTRTCPHTNNHWLILQVCLEI
jgi:hypothetical protein